jgi:hypothetical protein
MPYLSFDKGKGATPIAVVRDGPDEGKVLYVHEGEKKPSDIDIKRYSTELRDMSPGERMSLVNRLTAARHKGLHPDDLINESAIAKKLYERILFEDSKDKGATLNTKSQFQVLPSPDPEKRDIFYVCGASGSGKSYFAKGIAECYRKLHPSREVYLISQLEADDTLDSLKPPLKRINYKTFKDDFPALEEFKDCLVLFDDYDTIPEPFGKLVQQLIDEIAIQGRHYNTSMMCMSHYLTNFKKTRLIQNETTHFVVYPQATSFQALEHLLSTRVGMTGKEIRDLKKLGRWVCIYKNYPQWMVSAHTAKLVHQ